MSLPIRAIHAEEALAFDRAMALAFGGDDDRSDLEHLLPTLELERTRCAFDGDEMVGTAGTYSFEMAVPGGTLGCGGTSFISVRNTHRRRGLLRGMMRALLDDGREREEPLAALWASESGIYGRFGYGPGAGRLRVTIDRAHAAFEAPVEAPDSLRLIDAKAAHELLPQVYEQVWRERPGHFARSAPWWEHRILHDPKSERMGGSSFRYVVYEQAGAPRGYLKYRVKPGTDEVANGEVWVIELHGVDVEARRALWACALEVDLTAKVRGWNQPEDIELPWWLADPRRLRQVRTDALWVRVLDVERALGGRAYAAQGGLVLGVRDPFCSWNEGSYRLEAGAGGAHCSPTSRAPEVELDVGALGALYLGGHRFKTLARAGVVRGTPDALRRADALFSWDRAPWCPEVF